MTVGSVTNNGNVSGDQVRKYLQLHATSINKQNGRAAKSLVKRTREGDNQEEPTQTERSECIPQSVTSL